MKSPAHVIYEKSSWCNVMFGQMKPALSDNRVVGWYCTCGESAYRVSQYTLDFPPLSGDLWQDGVLIQRGSGKCLV